MSGPAVDRAAVRAGEDGPLVGRDRDEPVEGDGVADRPGRDHHQRGDARPPRPARSAAGGRRPASHAAGRTSSGRNASPSVRVSAARPIVTPRAAATAIVGRSISLQGEEQGQRNQQAVERLAHQRAVGPDEERVDGRERGRGQADGVAPDAPPEQADDRHGPCADERTRRACGQARRSRRAQRIRSGSVATAAGGARWAGTSSRGPRRNGLLNPCPSAISPATPWK